MALGSATLGSCWVLPHGSCPFQLWNSLDLTLLLQNADEQMKDSAGAPSCQVFSEIRQQQAAEMHADQPFPKYLYMPVPSLHFFYS